MVRIGRFFPLVFLLIPAGVFPQGSLTVRGSVSDSATKEPLAAANIRIVGTSQGTISNERGKFSLNIPTGSATLVISHIGYEPDTLRTVPQTSRVYDVLLKASPVLMPEMVVLAEDPALEIIRKAIAHKRQWMEKIKSYQFDAFTREILRRDTSIASITESYSTGYWRSGDTLREIVRQKRQTLNVPAEENFAAVRRVVNFNDDAIVLFTIRGNGHPFSYVFTGPTAPNALDDYEYKLLSTSVTNGVEIYRIRMMPKTRLKPLFDGTITIANGTFAVIAVDVQPNEAFVFPFLKDIHLRYQQQFALYNDEFWMPADIHIDGGFRVAFVGITLPRVGIELVSSIYDYAINSALPDSIFEKPHVTTDSSANHIDSTYWKSHEVLPLTAEEQEAYQTLDTSQTLEKQFQPKGPLSSLSGEGVGSLFDHVDARFNRVEGVFLGYHTSTDEFQNILHLEGSAGVGFSDQRFKYDLESELYAAKSRKLGLGAEWYSRLDNVPDHGFYGPFFISLASLIDKDDYRDYFLANGNRFFVVANPTRHLNATAGVVSERDYSLDVLSTYSFFSTGSSYRPNPPVQEGLLRSLRLDLLIGDKSEPLDLVSRDAVEISIEHSSPSIFHSEFDFTRYDASINWHVSTFGESFLFPPELRVTLSGGLGDRNLPPQRLFSLDSRASGYAGFGVLKGSGVREFIGDRYVMLAVEHNFRTLPFLALNLPFLYRNGIELVTHGAVAQTWYGTTSSSGGWYAETGIGISKILDILRVDLTYRWKDPARFFFTASIANIF
ncbi:MAG TPA: DUF5686 family protein [Bacteroidota bacterium]|nr:DUF5686 family protein [Bacteroidota bacterium]